MIPPNLSPLTGPTKINNRFCGPTLTHTRTYTNTHGLTNHAAGRAAFIISSNFEGSIESSSGWVVQQTIAHQVQNVLARKSDLQNAEDSGVVVVDLNLCLWNSKLQPMMGFKGSQLATQNFKGHGWDPLEGDPPTWIVMKLTAFKWWKISTKTLRNFRVDFSKTSVERLYPENLWQMIIQLNHQLGETKSKNRSSQDIYSMVFGVNDA